MPKRTGRPWRRRKRQVLIRDGYVCHLCGMGGADSADHLIPWSVSQDDSLANLRAVHHNAPPHCNRVRGDKPLDALPPELAPNDRGWGW